MADFALHFAGFVFALSGEGWLALSMETHWVQVRGRQPLEPRTATSLRWLGGVALLLALVACLGADHATMAPLVWVMTLTAAAFVVAFTFTFRPATMGALIAWIPTLPERN